MAKRDPTKAVRLKKVTSTEAKARWYALLDGAERGRSIAITRRGKIAAVLEPIPADEREAIARGIATGAIARWKLRGTVSNVTRTRGKERAAMIVLYGLKTCDTCKRARRFLDARGAAYRFHDVREGGLDAKALRAWAKEVGWEKLVNKTSATWRALPEADKTDLDEAKAIRLLLANPTLMKRPVLDLGDRRIVGFDEKVLGAALG